MSLSDSWGDSDGGSLSVALTEKYADKYSTASLLNWYLSLLISFL